MEITVYALFDESLSEIYVSMTNDLERRLTEHKRGQSSYTRKFKNFRLIYQECHPDYAQARKREKFFKNGSGKEFLRKLI